MYQVRRDAVLPAEGLPIATELLDGTEPCRLHTHELVELALVIGGSARHLLAGKERRVGAGYAVLLAPGECHAWSDVQDLRVWKAYLGAELFTRELAWLGLDGLARDPAGAPVSLERCVHPRSVARARAWLELVPSRHERGPAADSLRLAGLCGLLGEVVPARDVDPSPVVGGPPRDDTLVASAVSLMEQDLSRAWTVATLAAAVHVSPSGLSRAFTHELGCAPMAYLARLRADRVASDLVRDDTPVSEIGRRYGWADPSYLSRRFRHFYGVSPRAYRESGHPAHVGRRPR